MTTVGYGKAHITVMLVILNGLAPQPTFSLNPLKGGGGKLPQLWPTSLGTLCTHNTPNCIKIKFNSF